MEMLLRVKKFAASYRLTGRLVLCLRVESHLIDCCQLSNRATNG
jgi:hypothetical protein